MAAVHASRPAIRCILTDRDGGQRLAEQATPHPGPGEPGLPEVRVHPGTTFQSMEGFGGAFTEAAAVTWLGLGEPLREELLRAYFSRQDGHGYSLCRIPMGSCDFALGSYSHLEQPDSCFSIDRDQKAIIPFIKAAQQAAGRPIKLLASPWSPPGWMKSNGRMVQGGILRPECRQAWARCYVRFIQAYSDADIPIWGVSVQNEPEAAQRWESCLWTAQEECDFVRDFLGPELEAAGLGQVRIIIWDHNRDRMFERAQVVYSDPAAARRVWGTGFHWYGEDGFDQVQRVHDAWPGKQLLFTEGCQEGGPHHGSWELGERYARSMINDLNRWTAGWIDWNLLLDHRGGPNHVGNFCSAPILVSPTGNALLRQSSYFYLGHFARFVRPGALRALCASTSRELESTAFVNTDGSVAVVVLNRGEQAKRFALRVDPDQLAVARMPPRSIATYLAWVGPARSGTRSA
jgi:glucosylceramidase